MTSTKKKRDRKNPKFKKTPNWTPEELQQIKQWQKEKIPGKIQAQRLNRTYLAWKTAVGNHDLGNCRHWTAKEIQKITLWQEQGVPGKIQAQRLNRPYYAWKNATRRYKIKSQSKTYNADIRATIMFLLPLGYTQADVARKLNRKSPIRRFTNQLVKQGLLTKPTRTTYKATPEWTGQNANTTNHTIAHTAKHDDT